MLASTPTSRAKAIIRNASHTSIDTRIVKYVDLRPLASHRPVHMHTRSHQPVSVNVGDFVFFSRVTDIDVLAGIVTTIAPDGSVSVHEHRQAPTLVRRFVPLYLNTRTGAHEAREVAHDYHTPDIVQVPLSAILLTGTIRRYFIESHMLDSLRSLGVSDV